MQIEETGLDGVKLITPRRFGDNRGYFCEVFNASSWANAGIEATFIQDNQSFSAQKGTVRGLHLQLPPYAQAKIIRVLRGSIFDVAVDVRPGSASFGKFMSVTLSAHNWVQAFVPRGFAHGFCTLEPDTEVLYKVDNTWSAEHERSILWNDPAIGISWPVSEADATLSGKDKAGLRLADIPELKGRQS